MAEPKPQTITAWLKKLPVPWLFAHTNGDQECNAQGAVYDDQVEQVREAVKARMPTQAPADAMPAVGADRKLIQGYAETEDEFRQRCKLVWDQWALAGTWAEMLYQLYWTCGFDSSQTWIVQQNGYAYSLSANPAVDDDPTTLLVVTELGTSVTVNYPDEIPWWRFDDRDDLCSRFAIVLEGPLPGTICITARATFTAEDSVTVTWSGPFDDGEYSVMWSLTTTDSTIPFVAVTDKEPTTVTVSASAPFTGYVDLIGWVGENPFAGPSLSTRNLINQVAKTWKPAKAKYMGAYALADGVMWGWPIGTQWGQAGLKWGDSLVAYFAP